MFNRVEPIISLVARHKVPTIYPWRSVVARKSALLSYGPDLKEIVRHGAPYVDQILRGAKPADPPVQVPVKFEMAANAKTATTLGLIVPPSLLCARRRGDRIIWPMSAIGTKRTWQWRRAMSAIGVTADMWGRLVRSTFSKGDIGEKRGRVCFGPLHAVRSDVSQGLTIGYRFVSHTPTRARSELK